MSPHHTRKKQKLYRYYVSQTVLKHGAGTCVPGRIPAADIEKIVLNEMKSLMHCPDFVIGTWRQIETSNQDFSEHDTWMALRENFDSIFDSLFPIEQARLVSLLVERVDVSSDNIRVRMRQDMVDPFWEDIAAFT